MNFRHIADQEIAQRQQQVRCDVRSARTTFTFAGLRRLFGNTFIAFGLRLHGSGEQMLLPDLRTATGTSS